MKTPAGESPPPSGQGALLVGSTIAGELLGCAAVGFWLFHRTGQVRWMFAGLILGMLLSAYEFWKLIRASNREP